MQTAEFYYDLPEHAVAQQAIEPRDAARLLDTRTMRDHTVAELPTLLRSGDLVVVNRTRVRHARLRGRRPTGGAIEMLLLHRVDHTRWEALARPTRRLRAGSEVVVGEARLRVVADPVDGRIVVDSDTDLEEVAAAEGEMPLPPYFKGELNDPERYQTLFADRVGSAAAPTAGLHFTARLIEDLTAAGVEIARVDLEVGLDTFRPISADAIEDHEMHSEHVTVGPEVVAAIERTRAGGGRVVAVGTTVVRSLESAAAAGELAPMDGPTELFIRPGYRFRVVDLVLTNYHVPGSTLIVLVASILGDRWREVYASALERGYRFLSFGDAMLAEVAR